MHPSQARLRAGHVAQSILIVIRLSFHVHGPDSASPAGFQRVAGARQSSTSGADYERTPTILDGR